MKAIIGQLHFVLMRLGLVYRTTSDKSLQLVLTACNRNLAYISTSYFDPRPVSWTWPLYETRVLAEVLRHRSSDC